MQVNRKVPRGGEEMREKKETELEEDTEVEEEQSRFTRIADPALVCCFRFVLRCARFLVQLPAIRRVRTPRH